MVSEPPVIDLVWKRSYRRWGWQDVTQVVSASLPHTLVCLSVMGAVFLGATLRIF